MLDHKINWIQAIGSIPYAKVCDASPPPKNRSCEGKGIQARHVSEADTAKALRQLRRGQGSIAQQNCGTARKESAKRQRLCDSV